MRIEFVLKAPLFHGAWEAENFKNYSGFRRLPIISDKKIVSVPIVSGNALRGKMRREIMREMYKLSGMNIKRFSTEIGVTQSNRAWDRLYAALFSGGAFENIDVNIHADMLREIREELPPLSLFGSALYNTMLPGMMSVGFCFPVCRETVSAGLCQGKTDFKAAELMEDVSFIRSVDREYANPEETGVKQMIYQREVLIPGVVMQANVNFEPMTTEIEKHCAAHAAKLLHSIGGKGAGGFGQIEITSTDDDTLYRQWLKEDHSDVLMKLARQVI